MGYYIQTPNPRNRAKDIVELHGGEIIPRPTSLTDVPAGKSLIAVVVNGPFDAAGYVHDEREFRDFCADPTDTRPHVFLLLDEKKTHELTGYVPK